MGSSALHRPFGRALSAEASPNAGKVVPSQAIRSAVWSRAAWAGSLHVAWRMLLAVIAVALFPGALVPDAALARSTPDSFADLAARLLPAVVNVSTTQTVEGNPGIEMPQLPPGSPFELV